MMTPFQAGEMFLALRLHFTRPSYDYFKYHGKTTLTPDKFAIRSDKFLFAKLIRTYPEPPQFQDLVIANCLKDTHLHSRMLMMPEARDQYLAYRKIHESLAYVVEQDCRTFLDAHSDLNEWFRVRHTYPLLLTAVWQQRMRLETLILLNRVLDFRAMWETKIPDTIKWPAFLMVWKKYEPFVIGERSRYKTLLRSILTVPTY